VTLTASSHSLLSFVCFYSLLSFVCYISSRFANQSHLFSHPATTFAVSIRGFPTCFHLFAPCSPVLLDLLRCSLCISLLMCNECTRTCQNECADAWEEKVTEKSSVIFPCNVSSRSLSYLPGDPAFLLQLTLSLSYR
jgi:hypothetical protein